MMMLKEIQSLARSLAGCKTPENHAMKGLTEFRNDIDNGSPENSMISIL